MMGHLKMKWEEEGRTGKVGRDMGFTMEENKKIWEEVVKNGNGNYRKEVEVCKQPGCRNGWVRDILHGGAIMKCPKCKGYGFKVK